MSPREYLWAYLATLAALLLVLIAAFVAAIVDPNILTKIEAFGLGTVTGGLIGVLRMPTMRTGGVSDQTAQTIVDKIPPVTGDAAQKD